MALYCSKCYQPIKDHACCINVHCKMFVSPQEPLTEEEVEKTKWEAEYIASMRQVSIEKLPLVANPGMNSWDGPYSPPPHNTSGYYSLWSALFGWLGS